MQHIVKRQGHTEEFDSRKIYAASYAACRNAHLSEMQAEHIAETVTAHLEKWIDDKPQITSDEIFKQVAEILRELHSDAAFLYETHRDIS